MGNSALLRAQQNAKKAYLHENKAGDKIDEYMINAPDLTPSKNYRLKSKNGHFAYYYENEKGEPFLLDDNCNLWIWAGIDVENPDDDWLVRTPDGDILNFYVNEKGQLRQVFMGNERNLRVARNTNLGTLVGFINDDISSLHYEELPPSALKTINDPITGDKIVTIPAILEEGFIEFSDQKHNTASDNESKQKKFEIKNSNKPFKERYLAYEDPFTQFSNLDEVKTQNQRETKEYLSQESDRMNKRIASSWISNLKGVDVNHLPTALDYEPKGY
jgi:hypothetical protein